MGLYWGVVPVTGVGVLSVLFCVLSCIIEIDLMMLMMMMMMASSSGSRVAQEHRCVSPIIKSRTRGRSRVSEQPRQRMGRRRAVESELSTADTDRRCWVCSPKLTVVRGRRRSSGGGSLRSRSPRATHSSRVEASGPWQACSLSGGPRRRWLCREPTRRRSSSLSETRPPERASRMSASKTTQALGSSPSSPPSYQPRGEMLSPRVKGRRGEVWRR